ncbi:hypothetical protein KKA57_00850 [Patescibacteria group bacterium]|nr:hypothetical protein [Patescibacteria group bacterium]
MPVCKQCQNNFTVYPEDKEFYKRIDVPEPKTCADCSFQRRLVWRNERNFYKRKCDLTNQQIIAIYSPDKPFKVYNQKDWWGDKWSGLEFGREFDFSRPFFEQFKELMLAVPRIAIYNQNCDNSEFINHSANSKDSYMGCVVMDSENVLYSTYSWNCKDLSDCLLIHDSELCYESFYCFNGDRLFFSQNSRDCGDSYFLFDCHGCRDCFLCSNLHNQKNCISNKQYSQAEYEKRMKEMLPLTAEKIREYSVQMHKLIKENPQKALEIRKSEDSWGDYLIDCKSTYNSFNTVAAENCQDIDWGTNVKKCYRSSYFGDGELFYEANANRGNYNLKFVNLCYFSSNMEYCDLCPSCEDCFGCVGLKHKKYCIFNKQYDESNYRKIKEKIIWHMKDKGEYGEFFPPDLAPFCYNESAAQIDFPLERKEALSKGWQWLDENIAEINSDLPICTECSKNYKIIPQEKEFYEQNNLPLPNKCPNCRHLDRVKLRHSRHLVKRKCDKCQKEIIASKSLNNSEKVYCEECYKKEIY